MLDPHLYPKPDRPDNPTPLEMAIYNYELKARSHYEQRMGGSTDEELLEKLERDLKHLQNEKRRLLSVAVAQESLEGYRKYTESSSAGELESEGHHPTDKLAKFLTAEGEFKPTRNHQAHHIVPGKGQYQQMLMLDARLSLHQCGIGINDPRNGVWMLNYKKNKEDDWATADSVPHANIHRYNYETWIGERFASLQQTIFSGIDPNITHEKQRAIVIGRLKDVKTRIKLNSMPSEVMTKKNITWDGKS